MYSTFFVEECDGRLRNTLTVKFQRSLSSSEDDITTESTTYVVNKSNASASTSNQTEETRLNYQKKFQQKIQEKIDLIKYKINVRTDDLINKILLRKSKLISEANYIQEKLNENLKSYFNESFSQSDFAVEPSRTSDFSFNQNELNKIDALVEFKYDKVNEYNIGRIVNFGFPLSNFEKAKHFLHTNQCQDAIKCLEKVTKTDDVSEGEIYFLKGKCFERLNKTDLAIQCYDKAIQRNHIGAHNLKANLITDKSESKHLFEKAYQLNKNPLKEEDFLCKGNSLYGLEKYEGAIDHYEKAIQLASDYSAAYFNLANSHKQLEHYEKAIDFYDKAIRLNPNDDSSFFNVGLCLQKLGEFEEAIKSYNKVIDLNSSDINALNNKGICLGNLGNHESAIECYQKAIELDASDEDYSAIFNNKGFSLHHLKNYIEAVDMFDIAIRLNPNNNDAFNNKANSLMKLRRYKDAIACYNKAINLNPNNELAKANKLIALKEYKEQKSLKLLTSCVN